MSAIIAKMFMCLLMAFLLGFLLGYLIWVALKKLVAEWESKYKKLSVERDELSVQFNETNTKLGSVSKELEVNKDGWAKSKTELSERTMRIGELDGELSVSKKKIVELDGQVSQGQSKISELMAAVAAGGAAVAGTAAVSSGGSSDSSEEVKSLTLQLERCRARYTHLSERTNSWSMRLAELEAKTGEVTEPTWLLKEANNGAKDDLKEIHGVGPKMEEIMNKLGIFYFSQLAQMSPRDVAWISSKIETFPDRIYRDKWVEQAEKFANRDK